MHPPVAFLALPRAVHRDAATRTHECLILGHDRRAAEADEDALPLDGLELAVHGDGERLAPPSQRAVLGLNPPAEGKEAPHVLLEGPRIVEVGARHGNPEVGPCPEIVDPHMELAVSFLRVDFEQDP